MKANRIDHTEFKKLIGKWNTEGRILATESSPEMNITGTDSYELILDGHFMLHKAEVMMGNEKSETLELISLSDKNGAAKFEYYNNQGASGKMTGTLKGNALKIDGDGLRFRGQLNDGEDQLTGTWEKSDNQNQWTRFLDMKLTRTS